MLVAAIGIAAVEEQSEFVRARGRRHHDAPAPRRDARADIGVLQVAVARRARGRERQPVVSSARAIGQRHRHARARSDVVALTVKTGAVTVTVGLVAARVDPPPLISRNWYGPGVPGIVTVHVRVVTPVPTFVNWR